MQFSRINESHLIEDTEDIIFKRFPNLQKLDVYIGQLPDCSAEKICFPRLNVLNELEKLHLSASGGSFSEYTQWLSLTSDTLSRIARLPNLQELILEDTIIEEGKEWNMEDVTFQNLKSLKLDGVRFSEWQVDAEKSFPVLEMLDITTYDKLMEIPDSFGDIASLELIKVWFSRQLKESIFNIKEYVEEMTGEDKLEVCFQGRWSREFDQESNEKKLLQKIFNQVICLKEKFSEDDIDDDVADKLRKQLFGKRYLIVLDDMWDTETFDELTRPFPELQKGSRVILTSRKKEVALHGKCHSDPLYLRLLRSEESWE
ncbi:hypothetical protein MTR67_024807 [Solanum verrucosum]|uniref:NB-ARC domain-containing protein n=1 Tax=Solanum verrucosum TaxID=315347 RepID=A0AAF0QW05_SOLVR|nr:hypothetical protein MTR67_024807 [Solanum verrucosum]